MWKRFFEFTRQVILLSDKTERNSQDVQKLQQQVRDLTLALERLRYEIRHVADRDEGEREKMRLQLENELLRFERRLPPERDGR